MVLIYFYFFFNQTPLHLACSNGLLNIIKVFLSCDNIQIDIKNQFWVYFFIYETPLHKIGSREWIDDRNNISIKSLLEKFSLK